MAEDCARLGGAILRDARLRGPGEVREKARNDFVTEVDAASERAITTFLSQRFPNHAILAEEAAFGSPVPRLLAEAGEHRGADGGVGRAAAAGLSGEAAKEIAAEGSHSVADETGAYEQARAERAAPAGEASGRGEVPDHSASGAGVRPDDSASIDWIVDPLDGTKNFIHGFPAYAVSVAARGTEGLLAGAIYDPTRDELFSAARGEGATLNHEPIRVSSLEDPRRALVGTGFPFRFSHLSEPYLDSFRRVIAAVSDVRRAGSASLDLAYVACGRLDAFWELALSPWDVAAGWLLIEEAGGVMTDDEGGSSVFERGHVVAGGPALHRVLLEIARAAFAGRIGPRALPLPAPGGTASAPGSDPAPAVQAAVGASSVSRSALDPAVSGRPGPAAVGPARTGARGARP